MSPSSAACSARPAADRAERRGHPVILVRRIDVATKSGDSCGVRERLLGCLVGVVLVGCGAPSSPSRDATTFSESGSASQSPSAVRSSAAVIAEVPDLVVEVVTDGLQHGWDVGFLPSGQILVTERRGRFVLIESAEPGAEKRTVQADLDDVYATGEAGLMGMVLHPDFATSREFTTCQAHEENGRPVDVRLVTWRLSEDGSQATKVSTLLTGLPLATSGRHSGCRPEVGADGALYVGTGDTADGQAPQDLDNLGGKVLRLDLKTGEPLPDNPFANGQGNRQYVYTYGHRNIQGVAAQPGTGVVFTSEHGPSFDDEVNRLVGGGNYGWDPSQGGTVGGYDESVPMTDLEAFPDAVLQVWTSGRTTQAICGAEFLEGAQWGAYEGALVITALKRARLLVMRLDPEGSVAEIDVPDATSNTFGRLRAARLGPDGSLYVTTSNGDDDKLLRITPRL